MLSLVLRQAQGLFEGQSFLTLFYQDFEYFFLTLVILQAISFQSLEEVLLSLKALHARHQTGNQKQTMYYPKKHLVTSYEHKQHEVQFLFLDWDLFVQESLEAQ